MKPILLALLFIICIFVNGQKKITIKIKGITTTKSYYNSIKLKNVSINVYNFNENIATYSSDSTGKFEFDLIIEPYMVLEFHKDGFYSKRILFDTQNMVIDNTKKYSPFDFEIVLLNDKVDLKYDEIDFPITRIEYSYEHNDFFHSEKYTKNMIMHQEKALRKLLSQN